MPIFGQTTGDKPKHPSSSWANWKNGKFMAWDKTIPSPTEEDPDHMGAEVEVKLPKEIIVVAEAYCIKGYLADKGGVWSNEIYSFAEEPLTVRNNAGEILYEGLWKDIRDKVKAVQLKVTTNVHYIDPKHPDELKTFCIKGAASQEWYEEFTKRNPYAQGNNTITLKEVKEGKTGANKYTYPSFAPVNPLTQEQRNLQQEWGAKLLTYKNEANEEKTETEEVVNKYDDDNLPF